MRSKKPNSIFFNVRAAASPVPANVDPEVLALADANVLSTEDKSKFIALYREYIDEYRPQGPTQRDLVEDIVCARWRQRRCAMIHTGIMNVSIERRQEYVEREFDAPDNPTVTALAYLDKYGLDSALAKITREEAAHSRAFYRALKLLRELQKEKLPNEPKPGLTLVRPIASRRPSEPVDQPQPATESSSSSPEPPPSHACEAHRSEHP